MIARRLSPVGAAVERLRRRLVACGLIAISLLASDAARADNPRITLKLARATARDAVLAVSRATGNEVTVSYPLQTPEARASFTWEDAPLSRVLRDLTSAYHLALHWNPATGYDLSDDDRKPLQPVFGSVYRRDKLRVTVHDVLVQHTVIPDAMGRRPNDQPSADIQLLVQLDGEDAEVIAGIDNLTVEDDQGHRIDASYTGVSTDPATAPYPDQWAGSIRLPALDPAVRRLRRIDGDLLVYRSYRRRRFDVDVPAPGNPLLFQRLGALSLDALWLERLDQEPHPYMQLKLCVSNGPHDRTGPRLGEGLVIPAPLLVGASGAMYSPRAYKEVSDVFNGGLRSDWRCNYPSVGERITRIRFTFAEKSGARPLYTFGLRDVPLSLTDSAPAAPWPQAGAESPSPFRDHAGRALIMRVQLGSKVASGGELLVGLSRLDDGPATPVRWCRLTLEPDGTAAVRHVKPGRYRLLRTYHPTETIPLPASGHWENGELNVAVIAGQEVRIPDLVWRSDERLPATKSPMQKPAALKGTSMQSSSAAKPAPRGTQGR